jgi:DNA-binding transcriptional MerR regulator
MPANGSTAAALAPPGGDAAPGAGRTVKSSTAFRTISEVADELDVAQHVLRFWESKFPQVRPLKRGGGRRYYRPEDVELLRQIRSLLYDEGYTIKGAQKLLRARRSRASDEPEAREPAQRPQPMGAAPTEAAPPPSRQTAAELRRRLKPLLAELIEARDRLRSRAG